MDRIKNMFQDVTEDCKLDFFFFLLPGIFNDEL